MSKNIIEIALKAGFINTSNGLESPFIEGEDLTDNLKLFASLLLAQPETEQEPVAWQFRTFHGEYTACPGWDVWEDCTEPKFNNVSELITKGFYQVRKLYLTPPKREPLSDETLAKLWRESYSGTA